MQQSRRCINRNCKVQEEWRKLTAIHDDKLTTNRRPIYVLLCSDYSVACCVAVLATVVRVGGNVAWETIMEMVWNPYLSVQHLRQKPVSHVTSCIGITRSRKGPVLPKDEVEILFHKESVQSPVTLVHYYRLSAYPQSVAALFRLLGLAFGTVCQTMSRPHPLCRRSDAT